MADAAFEDVRRFQAEAAAQGVCWVCLSEAAKRERAPLALVPLKVTTRNKNLVVAVCPFCDQIAESNV